MSYDITANANNKIDFSQFCALLLELGTIVPQQAKMKSPVLSAISTKWSSMKRLEQGTIEMLDRRKFPAKYYHTNPPSEDQL